MRTAVIVRIGTDGKPSAQYYPDCGKAKEVFRGSTPDKDGELQLWRGGHAKPRIKRWKAPPPVTRPVQAAAPPTVPIPPTKKVK